MTTQVQYDPFTFEVEYEMNGNEVIISEIVDVDAEGEDDGAADLCSVEHNHIADIIAQQRQVEEIDSAEARMEQQAEWEFEESRND